MAYQTITLPCGLRLVHTPSATDVTYCGFCIDAGTRDEHADESGMAHFIEHLLFKGTTHRRAWHILNRLESVGGDLNAFTTKEDTTVYAAVPTSHFQRAAELLVDIVFNSTFPQNEIDKEVEVIIDEIQSYEDSPSELIFDEFEDLIYHGHPLGRNILGNPERLHQYTSEDALRFVKRCYQLQNMVFFVRTSETFDNVVKIMNRMMAHAEVCASDVHPQRISPAPYVPQQVVAHRDTHQAHVMLGGRAFDAVQGKRTGLYVLNNMLGGPGMNSRLNLALRERRGLVYNVESNLTNYTDTGTFSIYFGCDIEDVDKCLRICHTELKKLIDTPLTSSQLNAAKQQLKGQLVVACDNFENNVLDLAKAYLHYDKTEEMEEIYQRINAITSEELQQIASEVFAADRLSSLIYQ